MSDDPLKEVHDALGKSIQTAIDRGSSALRRRGLDYRVSDTGIRICDSVEPGDVDMGIIEKEKEDGSSNY